MKKMLLVLILMFWLALLVPAGHSQSKHPSAGHGKKIFVYDMDDMNVRLYRVQNDGALKFVYSDDTYIGQFPRCIIATPNGRSLYIAHDIEGHDYQSGEILEFAIKKNGYLTRLGSAAAGTLPLRMAMSKSGSFLYCSAEDGATGQGVLYQYKIERDGTLSSLKPPLVNLGKNLFPSLAVAPSEKYLYISKYVSVVGKPICFRISKTGTLTQLPTPPTQAAVEVIALSPSGKYAYCLQSGGVISVATVDQVTGRFSALRPVAHVPPASYSMAISPQRNTLQITNAYINSKNIMISGPISEFRLMPNSGLQPSHPPTFPMTFPAVKSYGRLAPNPSAGFIIVRSR